MEIKEGCRGCEAYYICYSSCGKAKDSEFVERCPCRMCLVKGMCINACNDLTNLVDLCRELRQNTEVHKLNERRY